MRRDNRAARDQFDRFAAVAIAICVILFALLPLGLLLSGCQAEVPLFGGPYSPQRLTNVQVSRGLRVMDGGATIADGGLTVSADGLTVSAGGETITAGNLTLADGVLAVTEGSNAATSGNGANVQITQSSSVTGTGTLRGLNVVATNGTLAHSGTIRGAEIKARAANASNEGAAVATLEGASINADPKNQDVTLMRGAEIVLDGAAGGAVTTAVGLEIDNNSSGTQSTSYALSFNQGTASGHKAFTADVRLQNGETLDNATDGTVKLTGNLWATGLANEINATDAISVTSAYFGKTVFLTHADAVAVSITPTAAAGNFVVFVLTGDDNLAAVFDVDGADDNLIAPNNATADSVTFGSGHRIGATVMFLSNGTSWVAINVGSTTMTVTDGA